MFLHNINYDKFNITLGKTLIALYVLSHLCCNCHRFFCFQLPIILLLLSIWFGFYIYISYINIEQHIFSMKQLNLFTLTVFFLLCSTLAFTQKKDTQWTAGADPGSIW